MSHRLYHGFARWGGAVRRGLWCVLLILTLLQITIGGSAAQEAGPAQVPGEILLGWRSDVAACAPVQAPTSNPTADVAACCVLEFPETCLLLNNLVPAGFQPAGPLTDQRSLPEWQAAQRSLGALTGLEVRDLLLPHGVARLGVPPGRAAAEIARLRELPWVAYAEPNYIARAATFPPEARYPNDPFIGNQWNMRRISAPQAWAMTQGRDSIVVAVLDSGVDLGHPEFSGRLMLGKNYLNPSLSPSDDYGHGTHVAGLIAANADNAIGISGLAPNVRLLPLKVLDSQGAGSYFNIAAAIRDATDLNAQIINLSLGGFAADQTLQNAVVYALSRGRLVVAASGNCAQGGQYCQGVNPTYYPAAYPGVLAIGASDRFDNWANYSGYKPYLSLAAPGGIATERIWSTWPGGYNYLHGTSMATPLASAAAALVWTVQPVATAQQVINILQNTADKIGAYPYISGRNDYFGYGRLNVANAVRLAYPPALTPINEVQRFLTTDPTRSSVRSVTLLNPSEQAIQWQAQVFGADWLAVDLPSGQATYSNPGVLTLRAGPASLAPGIYSGLVRVTPQPPFQNTALDIQVELRVVTHIRSTYLPLIMRDWYNISWQDPFAPGAPAPLPLILTNDTAYPVALPFPVTFYGQAYTAVWVSDNGLAWFGQGSSASTQPPTTCPPAAAEPNNAIYVLALDWDPALGGRVYAHRPDADTFAITWHEVRRPWNATPQSFQLVFRRTGEILASYRAIEALPPAIIGTENDDGTVAEEFYCHGTGRRPANGETFRFEARLPWR